MGQKLKGWKIHFIYFLNYPKININEPFSNIHISSLFQYDIKIIFNLKKNKKMENYF